VKLIIAHDDGVIVPENQSVASKLPFPEFFKVGRRAETFSEKSDKKQ